MSVKNLTISCDCGHTTSLVGEEHAYDTWVCRVCGKVIQLGAPIEPVTPEPSQPVRRRRKRSKRG